MPSSKPSSTDNIHITTRRTSLTSQNTTSPTILPRPLTKKYIYDTSLVSSSTENIPFATNQQNNIHIITRQPFLTRQNAQINTIKKNKKDNNHKDKKKPKKEKKDKKKDIEDIGSPTKVGSLTKDIIDTIDPITKISEEKAKHKPLFTNVKNLVTIKIIVSLLN